MSQSLLQQLVDAQGQSFAWLMVITALNFVGLCFVAGLLSRTPVTSKAPKDRVADMWYWLTAPVVRMICRLLVAVVLIMGAALIGHEVSPSVFGGFGPVSRQPQWLMAIEILVLADLTSYWIHRLFHTVPFLWRFHAIHHSATRITWSTAGRVHPVNELANYAIGILPAFLLGFPIGTALAMLPILTCYAVIAHAEWNPSFAPLAKIFASPRFHRWHHTMSYEGGSSNFSNVFSLWDLMFGSYYLPKDRIPEVFGLDDGLMPESYFAQVAAPFREQPLLPKGSANAEPERVQEPVAAAVARRSEPSLRSAS